MEEVAEKVEDEKSYTLFEFKHLTQGRNQNSKYLIILYDLQSRMSTYKSPPLQPSQEYSLV